MHLRALPLLCLVGCSETGINKVRVSEDTGSPPEDTDTGDAPPSTESGDNCGEALCIQPLTVLIRDLDDGSHVCELQLWAGDTDTFSDGSYHSFGGHDSIEAIYIFGDTLTYPSSVQPESLAFVRETAVQDADGYSVAADLTTYPLSPGGLDPTIASLPLSSYPSWEALASGVTLGTINDMWEEVRGPPPLTVFTTGGFDVLQIQVDPTEYRTSSDCERFLPLVVCVDFDRGAWEMLLDHDPAEDIFGIGTASASLGECDDEDSAAAMASPNGEPEDPSETTATGAEAASSFSGTGGCRPGVGTFAPIPVPGFRTAGGSAGLAPIQVAGTGALTRDARLASWHQLAGPTLMRLFGGDVDPRHGMRLIDMRSYSPPPALAAGELWFGVDSSGQDSSLWPLLEMVWDCDGSPKSAAAPAVGTGQVPSSLGFTLADVGCPVDWPQRFRLETGAGKDHTQVRLGLEGRGVSIPIGARAAGTAVDEISARRGGLQVQAGLIEADESGSTLHVDGVTWHGISVCQPGSFRINGDGW